MEAFWADILIPGVPVVEKVLRPVLVYLFLVVGLRLAGMRTLAQLNPFDLIVLMTISNTLQNAIIGNDTSVLGGFIGAASLLALNWITVRLLFSHPRLDRLLEGHAVVLISDGRLVERNLRSEVITHEELMAAVHRQGVEQISDVQKAILEANGTISVFARHPTADDLIRTEVVERLARLEARLGGHLAPGSSEGRPQPAGGA